MENTQEIKLVDVETVLSQLDVKEFDEILDEVEEITGKRDYDKALKAPRLFSIILSKQNGREVLKQMIIDSQQEGYETVWSRAKVYNLVRYLEKEGLEHGNTREKLSRDEFLEALNIFEICKKAAKMYEEVEEKNTSKQLVKTTDN